VITLAIDASTYLGTVAVIADGKVIAEGEAAMRGENEERLMPMVASTLAAGGVGTADVERIVCGSGPGSFTSLRIAASLAKGLAMGAGLPLYAVPSLALLVASRERASGDYAAVMDAMRGEWYAAVYTVSGRAGGGPSVVSEREPARVVTGLEMRRLSSVHHGRLVGATLSISDDGTDVTTVNPAERPHARGVVVLDPALVSGPVELGSWSPVYGRLAEAQVKWEAAHGRALPSA
jgi:tRNA threonylcarbamoyladenosine biosynthesis protein TsaB